MDWTHYLKSSYTHDKHGGNPICLLGHKIPVYPPKHHSNPFEHSVTEWAQVQLSVPFDLHPFWNHCFSGQMTTFQVQSASFVPRCITLHLAVLNTHITCAQLAKLFQIFNIIGLSSLLTPNSWVICQLYSWWFYASSRLYKNVKSLVQGSISARPHEKHIYLMLGHLQLHLETC